MPLRKKTTFFNVRKKVPKATKLGLKALVAGPLRKELLIYAASLRKYPHFQISKYNTSKQKYIQKGISFPPKCDKIHQHQSNINKNEHRS